MAAIGIKTAPWRQVNEPSCSSSAPWRQTTPSIAAAQLPAPLATAPWCKVDAHAAAAALPAPASASSSSCDDEAGCAEKPTSSAPAEEIEDDAARALARFLSACEPPSLFEERSLGQSDAEDVPKPPPPPSSSDEGSVQSTEPPPPPDDELLPKLPAQPLPVSPASCVAEVAACSAPEAQYQLAAGRVELASAPALCERTNENSGGPTAGAPRRRSGIGVALGRAAGLLAGLRSPSAASGAGAPQPRAASPAGAAAPAAAAPAPSSRPENPCQPPASAGRAGSRVLLLSGPFEGFKGVVRRDLGASVLVELPNKTEVTVQEGGFCLAGAAQKRRLPQPAGGRALEGDDEPGGKRARLAEPAEVAEREARDGEEACQGPRRAVARVPLLPWEATLAAAIRKQSYLPFERVQCFSVSRNCWVNARVASVSESGEVTVLYAGPTGQVVKHLPAASKDIRRPPTSTVAPDEQHCFEIGHAVETLRSRQGAAACKGGASQGGERRSERVRGARGGA